MSPPGISLSYAADDEGTALDEMQDPGTYALAEFEILKPAPVLDLTRVPPVPSFFDAEARGVRSSILFLSHSLRKSLARSRATTASISNTSQRR